MKKLFAILLLVAFVGAYTAPAMSQDKKVTKVAVVQEKDKKASKKEASTATSASCCTETKKEASCCSTATTCTGTCTEMKSEKAKKDVKK